MAFGLSASTVGLIGAGANLVGGLMGADAASGAADAQSQAADRASATQEAARLQQRQDLMPWTKSGGSAQNRLAHLLGIGRDPTASTAGMSFDQIYAMADLDHRDQYGIGINQLDPSVAQPWIDGMRAGAEANKGKPGIGGTQFGSLLKKFDQSDLDSDLVYQNGLQFGLNTGLNQLNQRAAAGGNYGSGAALKALTRFGNDYATTKTEGAYNRNQGEKAQTYNFLGGVSQQGQNAAAGVGAAGINSANNIANNQLGAGNAQAAGIVGGANAMSGGLAGATNAFQWNQLMSRPSGSGLSNSWDIPMQPGGGY